MSSPMRDWFERLGEWFESFERGLRSRTGSSSGRRTLRHPFGGDHYYARPPRRPHRQRARKIQQPRMRPRRHVNVSGLVAEPEKRPGRPMLRLNLFAGLMFVLLGVLVLRLWSLQVVNTKTYASAVTANEVRQVTLPAPRGLIVDRSDHELTSNVVQYQIVLSRSEATQNPQIVGMVAALVGETPAQVEAALNNVQFSPYEPVPVLNNAPPQTVEYLQEHQADFPGVSVQQVTERSYPQGDAIPGATTAAHVLGYVGPITGNELSAHPNDGYTEASQVGQAGLEAQYEQYLRGKDGTEDLAVNAQGDQVGILKKALPTQGDTLVTNLDLGLQQYVEQSLYNDIQADRQQGVPAPSGAAVVMDAHTGQVLAMASNPSYDLNEWVGGISDANYKALSANCNTTSNQCPLDDYAIQGLYTPGSTFKLATATASLQDGLISPTDTYNDTGTYTIPGCTGNQCTFHGADAGGLGPVNVTQAITASDDIYFYNLGVSFWQQKAKYGETPIQDTANQLGLGTSTLIDLPDESQGAVDSPKLRALQHAQNPSAYPNTGWYAGDNLEMSFGQGETVVTPIEEAQAYATFANGGTRYQPQVANAVVSSDGKLVKQFTPTVLGHVTYSPANYQAMMQGFEGVVSDPSGTAYGTFQADAHVPPSYPLAGKTGTADVSPPQQPNAWFVGFGPTNAPANQPEYVVAVVVQQAGYGAQAAAPAVANIFNYLYANPVQSAKLPGALNQPLPTPPTTVPPVGSQPAAPSTTTTTAAAIPALPRHGGPSGARVGLTATARPASAAAEYPVFVATDRRSGRSPPPGEPGVGRTSRT